MTGTYPAEVFFIALLYGWAAPILTSTLALHYNNLHSKKTFFIMIFKLLLLRRELTQVEPHLSALLYG